MKFRITEDTFFQQQERAVGEIMEAPVGPYRNVVGAGGLKRIPQFEVIEETTRMADPVVPPPNLITPRQITEQALAKQGPVLAPIKKDVLVTSLTGALNVADALMRRIEQSKARHIAAGEKVGAAFGKLDGASEALEGLAIKAEAEAEAVLAKLGQVSNG